MKNIVITGSLAFDLIMDFDGKFAEHIDPTKLHILNISFLVESLKRERGGNSGNMAFTLSLLGIPSSILSNAGDDFEPYAEFLKSHNIGTEDIKIIKEESTATATIMTDKADNQISAFYPGAMKQNINLSLKEIKSAPEFAVITPDLPKAMVKFALECKELKISYLFDPGMQLPRLSDEQLLSGIEGAEILVANDYEMGIITKRLMINESGLMNKVKILITTLGEKGSVIQTQEQKIEIAPAKPEEVKDPTGAGDAYRSGFLAGYLRDLDLKTCGQMGSIASCYAIEKYGTTNHVFTIEEFLERYKENFGEELKLS
jgi:adenosine kinase